MRFLIRLQQRQKNERLGENVDENGMPLISVDELKKLVYEKSGYKMQLASGDDPLLTTIYINQVVLGQAIEYARKQMAEENIEHIERCRKDQAHVSGVSEKQLNKAVIAVQKAADQIAGVQTGIEDAAGTQAIALLNPALCEMQQVLKGLKDKDGLVVEHWKNMQQTQAQWAKTEARWAGNVGLISCCVVLVILIVAGCSFYAGRVLAQKDIAQNAEWLDTQDGKYAMQLKDAGSLKALATCSVDAPNDWAKSKDGKVCFPYPTNGRPIGWHIQ